MTARRAGRQEGHAAAAAQLRAAAERPESELREARREGGVVQAELREVRAELARCHEAVAAWQVQAEALGHALAEETALRRDEGVAVEARVQRAAAEAAAEARQHAAAVAQEAAELTARVEAHVEARVLHGQVEAGSLLW